MPEPEPISPELRARLLSIPTPDPRLADPNLAAQVLLDEITELKRYVEWDGYLTPRILLSLISREALDRSAPVGLECDASGSLSRFALACRATRRGVGPARISCEGGRRDRVFASGIDAVVETWGQLTIIGDQPLIAAYEAVAAAIGLSGVQTDRRLVYSTAADAMVCDAGEPDFDTPRAARLLLANPEWQAALDALDEGEMMIELYEVLALDLEAVRAECLYELANADAPTTPTPPAAPQQPLPNVSEPSPEVEPHPHPDGPRDPDELWWRGSRIYFSEQRLYLLLKACWPAFRLRSSLTCDQVNESDAYDDNPQLSKKTVHRYARELSQGLEGLKGFPARLVPASGDGVRWKDLLAD